MKRNEVENFVLPELKPIRATKDLGNVLLERMAERFRDQEACEDVSDFFLNDGEEISVPVFMGGGKRKQRTTIGSGGGSLSTDSGDGNFTQTPCPPPANRGATIHEPSGEPGTAPDDCPHIMGGYDGGTTIGFDGKWSEGCLEILRKTLDLAKEAAQLGKEHPDRIFEAGGRFFTMFDKSAGGQGVTYNYIFEGGGVKFYIHSRPVGDIQPVRVCYEAEGLIGRDLFMKHTETLAFLREIGFEVSGEKISRVDFQVMLFRDIEEFMSAFSENRVCCTARKYAVYGDGFNKCSDGVRLGTNMQICIYDKRQELFAKDKNGAKRALMIQNCFGEEWLTEEIPTTRVEFRLNRKVLKDMKINSLDDLLTHEADLVRYCTFDWFRMLSEPKKKGHTHEQEISELWQEVQAAFRAWFPGADGHREEVRRERRKTVSCDMSHIARQVEGCLKTIIAKSFGVVESVEEAMTIVYQVVGRNMEDIFVGSVARAREFMASKFEPEEADFKYDKSEHGSVEYWNWTPYCNFAPFQPLLAAEFYD